MSRVTSFAILMIIINIITFANCDISINSNANDTKQEGLNLSNIPRNNKSDIISIKVSDIKWEHCNSDKYGIFDVKNLSVNANAEKFDIHYDFVVNLEKNSKVLKEPYARTVITYNGLIIHKGSKSLCKYTQCPIKRDKLKLSGSGSAYYIYTSNYYKINSNIYSKKSEHLGCINVYIKFSEKR